MRCYSPGFHARALPDRLNHVLHAVHTRTHRLDSRRSGWETNLRFHPYVVLSSFRRFHSAHFHLLPDADDIEGFSRDFQNSLRDGNDLTLYYRFRMKDDRYIIFEITGHPYYAEENGQQQIKCFFAMGRPYPSKNTAMLDSFLELKIENERLRQELHDMYTDMESGGDGTGQGGSGSPVDYGPPSNIDYSTLSSLLLDSCIDSLAALSQATVAGRAIRIKQDCSNTIDLHNSAARRTWCSRTDQLTTRQVMEHSVSESATQGTKEICQEAQRRRRRSVVRYRALLFVLIGVRIDRRAWRRESLFVEIVERWTRLNGERQVARLVLFVALS